jgi:hypothetical protein
MTCFTFSTSTANCITDRQFRSVCTTTLAMLRCTKSSPGSRLTISLAGTRLSEQPIQRYFGRLLPGQLQEEFGIPRADAVRPGAVLGEEMVEGSHEAT